LRLIPLWGYAGCYLKRYGKKHDIYANPKTGKGTTEGKDLEECRAMLRDALHEMVLAYKDLGKKIPLGNALIEQLSVEVEHVSQTA